ncbi:heat shock factor binding protein [Actinidia rufa]|uniref:Heat shock factor binding protein n=1 Tax=Actinidia rufa TaxID=165716 RepID=A0A7J0DK03_9ERIC|nr:heat shock factor binding protein [Actinidia rufa]GFZ19441.1 heat shock factor binding protein [Actinidia rufa]
MRSVRNQYFDHREVCEIVSPSSLIQKAEKNEEWFLNFKVLDEMGSRINELEQSINDLRAEMGAEGSPSPLAPLEKPDEVKPEDVST